MIMIISQNMAILLFGEGGDLQSVILDHEYHLVTKIHQSSPTFQQILHWRSFSTFCIFSLLTSSPTQQGQQPSSRDCCEDRESFIFLPPLFLARINHRAVGTSCRMMIARNSEDRKRKQSWGNCPNIFQFLILF